MSGAYVAQPEVYPPVVYPPGWDPTWIFPGPYPPGFTPQYGMFLSASPSMSLSDPVATASTTVFQVTSGGAQAPGDAANYSATVNGSPRNLRLTSGATFLPSVVSNYADDPGLYMSTPSLTFDLIAADQGKTLVLTVDGSPFGTDLTRSVNITIDKPPPSIIVTPTEGLQTTSAGGTATFTVRLSKAQKKNTSVIIQLNSNNEDEGKIDKDSLSLTKNPQTVTITGQNDGGDYEVPVPYAIILSNAVSADPNFSGQKPSNVLVQNGRNPWRIEIVITSITATSTRLGGGISGAFIQDESSIGAAGVGDNTPGSGPGEWVTGDGYSIEGSYIIKTNMANGVTYDIFLFADLDDFDPGYGSASVSVTYTINIYNGDVTEYTHGGTLSESVAWESNDFSITATVTDNTLTIV